MRTWILIIVLFIAAFCPNVFACVQIFSQPEQSLVVRRELKKFRRLYSYLEETMGATQILPQNKLGESLPPELRHKPFHSIQLKDGSKLTAELFYHEYDRHIWVGRFYQPLQIGQNFAKYMLARLITLYPQTEQLSFLLTAKALKVYAPPNLWLERPKQVRKADFVQFILAAGFTEFNMRVAQSPDVIHNEEPGLIFDFKK